MTYPLVHRAIHGQSRVVVQIPAACLVRPSYTIAILMQDRTVLGGGLRTRYALLLHG